MTYTPGPWHIEPKQWDHGATIGIYDQCGFCICEIPPDPDIQTDDEPNYETVVRHPPDEANARLIAAAPAMLDILAKITEDLEEAHSYEVAQDHAGDDPADCLYCQAIATAKALMAQATQAPEGDPDN